MTLADGSILQTFNNLNQTGVKTFFLHSWPKPSATAYKIIAVYAAFEAALQLLLPGKTVHGPVSPAGNVPVYKVNYHFSFLFFFLNLIGSMIQCCVVVSGEWCCCVSSDFDYLSWLMVVRLMFSNFNPVCLSLFAFLVCLPLLACLLIAEMRLWSFMISWLGEILDLIHFIIHSSVSSRRKWESGENLTHYSELWIANRKRQDGFF